MKKANEPDDAPQTSAVPEPTSALKLAPAPDPAPAAKPPEAAAPQTVAGIFRGLTEDRWQLKEHRNPGHWACVPYGTTIDQITEPKFWANVARHLRPNSTIEVHWDDSSQFAQFYVLSAGRNWASVSLLSHHKLDKPKMQQQASEYGVSYAGPVDRFRVTRLADNAVIRAGFPSEGEARKFLDEYLRKLAA